MAPVACVLLLISCACAEGADGSEGWEITASDKAFFEQIRSAILTDDINWLGDAVAYPIILRPGGHEMTLKNKRALKKKAKLILNDHLKSVIRTQSANTLFKNWQGVMIGDGEIWYSQIIEKGQEKRGWVFRVIAIN